MMKAFSFLTILESLSKKLSILRTKMHSDNLRVDYESITSQLRVSRPFSRTSFGASFGLSRRASHFAAILTILFTVGVGNVSAQETVVETRTATNDDNGMRNAGTYLKAVVLGANASWSSNKIKISSTQTASFVVEINDAYSTTHAIKQVVFTYDGNGRPTSFSGNEIAVTDQTTWNATEGKESKKVEFSIVAASSEIKITQIKVTLISSAGSVAVTGVSLNKPSTTLEIGETETLTATITPNNATNKNVAWSSSNTSVATVDENGVVTAVAAGTATITVTTADGNKTATCAVTVNAASSGGEGDDDDNCVTITNFDTSQGSASDNKPDSESKYLFGYTDANKTSSYTITTSKTNNKGENSGNDLYLYYGTHVNIYANNITDKTPKDFTNVTSISLDVKMVKSGNTSSFSIKVGDNVVASAVSVTTNTYTTFTYNNLNNLDGKITIIAGGSSTNHHIYVDNIKICYTPDPNTVSFDANGGEEVDPITQTAVGAAILLPTATRDGCTFKGWYTDASGGTKIGEAGESYIPTDDITLYAQWILPSTGNATITYTLTRGAATVSGEVTGVSTITDLSTQFAASSLSIGSNNSKDGYCGQITGHSADGNQRYVSLQFKVTDGYEFEVSDVNVTIFANSTSDMKAKVVLSDGTTNIESEELTCASSKDSKFTFPDAAFDNKSLKGTVTLYIYQWGVASKRTYIQSPVTITGTIRPTCAAPTLSYETTAVTKTFGEAAFTNTLTNTNGVAVTYSSSDESVATVAANGQVTIVGAGETTITASSAEQTVSGTLYCEAEASYTLTVNKANISPTLTYNPNSLAIGGTANPNLTGNTGNGTVTYSSSNTSVATVNQNGVVTAVAEGTATITATIDASDNYNGGTATCQISVHCTAPTSVTIDGAWDKFGGETISLKATATGGSGNYTYQWQKYYDSNWNNITDNATATTENLVYENCDGSHSGTYRCVVSTGTDCSTASDGLQVKVYTLECYTNGTNIYHFHRNGNTQSGTLTLDLNANTAYKFKVHVDNDYYGNGGTINKDETNWVLGAELGTPDLTVNSGLGGTFTFTIDYSESGYSNTLGVPELSVTYPRKTIYLNPGVWNTAGAKYAIYYFIDGHNAWSNLLVGDACGTYTTIPQWNGVTMVAVRLSNDATEGIWEKKWNQTGNIPVNNNDYIEITGWGNGGDSPHTYTTYTVPTYSITFNGNGNTGGSMTNVTGITCGGSATLTQNTFTRTGYTFAGWATAAEGEKVYDDKATISNITSNITLYAKWTVDSYNTTTNFTNVSMTGEAPLNQFPSTLQYGSSLSRTFVANSGYRLPETITVTGATYTWDSSTGVLSITNVTGEVSVTITGIQNTYTITYNINRPTKHDNAETETDFPAQTTVTVNAGSTITLPNPSIKIATITVYTAKWKDASDNEYIGGAKITPTGDMTLTAQWTPQSWNIRYYESFDGTNLGPEITGLTPNQYTYGVATSFCADAETIVQKANKTGYTWLGWWNRWDIPEPQNPITTATAGYSGEFSLFAKWEADAPVTPEPDNCGISECGNATLTYTINASTNTTNTADNLLSSATASNTAALGVNNKAVFSTIAASGDGKAAEANACFTSAPVMSSKISMPGERNSYNADNYIQFTFTVKDGYAFTPCDIQFIVQPVMSDANFRWAITDGATEYGSGTATNVPLGLDNGATVLTGITSPAKMIVGTYYIRLYPYDDNFKDYADSYSNNSFRISNDVILKGTIEEVVCTTPDAPTAFAVGSITSNGATFTITDAANTNNYEIYYSTTSTAPTAETEATITTTEKTKAVTGLTAETTYYAWVRAVCNEENKSSWVALTNNSFTTSAELTPGDCVTIFEAKATGESPFFSATTGTITSSNLSEGDELNIDGYKFAVKPNSSNALKIAPKAGETFKVGDKLTFVVYTAKDKEIGFVIGGNTYTQSVNKSLYYFEQELKETDITDGATTITFNRNSADARWVEVKIERCAQLPSCTTPVLSNLENKKVCPGEAVSWTAIVNNTATLQENGETIAYQWNKKGNNTVLSNTATLTLNDITEAAGGTYVVTATVSANGKASATATKEVTLTVTPATATPTITASASTVYAGNPVTLKATCASSEVTYQWYTCNADGTNAQAIGGATNTTYTFTAGAAGTYYYKVIVTGNGTHSCGDAEKVYELVVKTPSAGCYDMIIFDSSKDQTIPAENATGTEANTGASWANVGTSTKSDPCTYTYNDKTYKKGWKFVSGSTSSNNRYIQFVIPEGYTGSLFLAAYSTSTNRTVFIDTKPTNTVNNTYASIHISTTGTLGTASAVLNPGTYYVCATDGLHLVELSIEICSDVNCTDPQVTATVNNVNNTTVCEGTENVTFTATNYADGTKTFQWQKKDGNTWTNINGATSATYTIPSVTTDHAGQYRVIAEKNCKRISEEVTLTVLTAPTFNTFADEASVMKGNALAISDVQATGATGYAWYKSADNSFNAAEDTKVGTSKDLLLAAASIPEAADQTFYLFCVASNSCGSVTSNAITVTVTPFVEEECATKGNEGDREFGFKNTSCSSITYESKSAWETNSSKEYLTYTAPAGRYFATAKVTVAHTNNSKAVYGYSTNGGTTWTYEETYSAVPDAYTTITIELPADVNAFCIGRNMDGKGTGTGKFYLAEICFTYTTMCTETTLTVGSYNNEYNISTQMDFVEPTFTLKAGETALEGQTLTYTSSNTAIATVDEDGNVTFEGITGTVTITATFAGGEINETEYCACQGSYTITVGCKDQAPKIVAAAGTKLDGCNNSITLEAKMQNGTAFADGTFQWYRDGEAIEGATSASYIVVRAGTYTVSRTYTCTMMSSISAVVTNEKVEPEVERLTPFQYYHVDKTYSNQMKNRHLFAVTSYGTYEGKRYHLTATRNGETLNLSSSNAFFTIPSSDNAVDTVMIDLNELKGKYAEGDEIVITCAPINSCDLASAITSSITIHVIGDKPTLALICSGANGEGTRDTKELVVGGDFLTGYNKADLCQQTGNKTFNPNIEWGFYTELKEKYIVTPVNGYAEFNKLNYEPFDILLLTDYPKASKSEAAATILDDMAALCDYRPLLSLKAHMVAKSPSKWAAKGFTTSPVVPDTTSQYANIVCYAHPMFDNLDDAQKEGIYHDHDDFNQLVYKILTGPGHEGNKGLQGFELKDADNFVTIGLVHYNATAEVITHDNHTHLEWTPAADDRQLVAIAERQANIEARMILFAINCGAQSMQTPMGRQVLLTCLDYLLKTDPIEVADCRLTFDNGEGNTNWDADAYEGSEGTGTKGDGLWSTAANWGPGYNVVPGRNNDVRIAAPCTVDADKVEVLSIHITEDGSLTIPADKSLTARSTILRADEDGNVYPTNVEDISLGSNAGGNASLILNNERGDTKAGVAMYSKAEADMEDMSAANSKWQYIGTPHSDVQNAANNYYNSWLYQYDTGTQGWAVIPNGGPLDPFRGYCITHPERGHTYWMEGTLAATTNQDITIPAGKFVVVANSWTAPIQIHELTDDDMEGLDDKTIYFFNTGSDSNQEGQLNIGRYAAGTYVSVPIHSAPYTGDSYIPSMQGFYVVGGTTDGTLHLDYERHVRAPRTNTPSGPMHAPARRVAADNEPQVAKFLFRGKRYDDRLIILERPDFTRGYDSGWDGEQWGGNAAAPMSYVVTETRWDAVSAIPEYEGTVIAFRAGEDSEYTIHFDYDGMEDALYLLDTDTQIYTRVLKGNSYTFTCADKAEHNRFILTRKAPQIATGTDHINTGENAKAVKFIKDDKIFIFVNGMLYDATGKIVIR